MRDRRFIMHFIYTYTQLYIHSALPPSPPSASEGRLPTTAAAPWVVGMRGGLFALLGCAAGGTRCVVGDWMDAGMDGGTGGWMDGWMDGWMQGWGASKHPPWPYRNNNNNNN